MARNGLQGLGHLPYEKDEYYEYACTYLGFEVLTKKALYDQIGYIPLPTMEKLHRSRANIRVLVGGNRSGKSYGAALEAIAMLFVFGTCGWIVSANYDLAEEIRRKIEDFLLERCGMEKVPRPEGMKPWQFYYGTKAHTLVMGNGSWLQLKSAESPNSMHAVPLDYIIVDEAALISYQLLETRLMPRLADTGGWLLAIGTLELLVDEWFQEYYNIGQVPNEWNVESWHHPTEDNYHVYIAKGGETAEEVAALYHANPHKLVDMNPDTGWPLSTGERVIIWNIDLAWLAQQKKRLVETWQEHVYRARYEAKPTEDKFRVFSRWSVTHNVNNARCKFDAELPVYLAVDPGGTYAVAAIQLKKFDEECFNELSQGYHVCVIDEIYFQNTVTTHEVYRVAQEREWWYNVSRQNGVWEPFQGVIDVTAKEQSRTWEHLAREDSSMRKLHLRSKRVDVQPGIQTLQHFLETDTIWANSKCSFTNLEFKRHHYREPSFNRVDSADPHPNNPVDDWNHLIKAITYFVVNKFGFYGKSTQSAKVSRDELIRRAIENKKKWQRNHSGGFIK